MNWTNYINHNRDLMLRMLVLLFASIGLDEERRVETLSRFMRSKILYVLRPAESALRRLIILRAEMLKAQGYVPPERAERAKLDKAIPRGNKNSDHVPCFPLIDPRKWFWWIGTKSKPRYTKGKPGIYSFDSNEKRPAPEPEPEEPCPGDQLDATRLCNRLLSLKAALEDITKHAKRLLRAQARNPKGKDPIRPGWPPGWRNDGRHEIDGILRECHRMAMRATAPPDTS